MACDHSISSVFQIDTESQIQSIGKSRLNWALINHAYSKLEVIQIMGNRYAFHSVNLIFGFSSKVILGMVGTSEGHCIGSHKWYCTKVIKVILLWTEGNAVSILLTESGLCFHFSPFAPLSIKYKFFPKHLLHANSWGSWNICSQK